MFLLASRWCVFSNLVDSGVGGLFIARIGEIPVTVDPVLTCVPSQCQDLPDPHARHALSLVGRIRRNKRCCWGSYCRGMKDSRRRYVHCPCGELMEGRTIFLLLTSRGICASSILISATTETRFCRCPTESTSVDRGCGNRPRRLGSRRLAESHTLAPGPGRRPCVRAVELPLLMQLPRQPRRQAR